MKSLPFRTSINTSISRLELRRCSSEPEFRNSSNLRILNKVGSSTSFTALTVSQECFEESSPTGDRESNRISLSEEFEFPGGGKNKSRISSGCGGDGNRSNVNRGKIHAYYQQMFKLDPTNALLLTNYGKYLHEVEGDFLRAEECYGRAILSSTNDGELLCLYGNLIWETQRDESRARSYFRRACQASPNNSFVLGSYSHFSWEAEEDMMKWENQILNWKLRILPLRCKLSSRLWKHVHGGYDDKTIKESKEIRYVMNERGGNTRNNDRSWNIKDKDSSRFFH